MKKILLLLALLLAPISADAASRFAVCAVTCTWDGASTAMWSATSGGATGASVPGSADTVTLDAATCVGGVTCTITVNTTVTVLSITMGACTAATTGCIIDFSANNNNVTLSATTAFSGTGTGTRTLNLGNGTWTLSASSAVTITPWNCATVTNMTLNANSSTIVFSGTGIGTRAFSGGGLTYSTFNIGANSSGGAVLIQGSNTFANLGVTAPLSIALTASTTQTITNAFTWTGSSVSPLSIIGGGASSTISVASGTPTITWAGIRSSTFTGGATFAATNSLDLQLNSGITITPPSGGGGGAISQLRPGISQ